MKLNLDIICDRLPDYFLAKKYGHKNQDLSLDRPVFYDAGSKMDDNTLYIARSAALSPVIPPKNTAVICIGKTLPKKWLSGDTQLLAVSDKFSAEIVCNEVQNIFNRFDAIENATLRELCEERDFDITRILRLCTEAMENPLIVMDSTLKDMLSSTIDKQHDNKLLIEVSDTPFDLTLKKAAGIKNVCESERQIFEPFISSLNVQGARSYCYNFYQMGYFIGFAYFIESCHLFRESDYPIANYFFPYIKEAYLKHLRHKAIKETPETIIVQKLFKHSALSDSEYKLFELAPNELWTCFNIIKKRDERHMNPDYMCITINSLLKNTAYAVDMGDDYIAGILRIQQDENKEGSTLTMFGNLVEQIGYMGGFSDTFTDIHKLDKYLLQAEHAVNMHNQDEDDATMLFFQDYILEYFLQAGVEMLPVEMLYSKGLRTLLEYDRRKHTGYARTLETWLKNETNLTQTAKELFIQRSSLVKRLDKIKRLTGEDLADPDIRLYYRICFRLLKN